MNVPLGRFSMKVGLAVVVGLIATLVGGTASAATVSFDDTYGPLAIPSAPAPIVTLPKFDPAFGTLTKVTLTLDANTSAGSIDWDNEAGVPSDVTLGIGAEVNATAPSALTVVAVPLQTGSSTVTADNDGAADFIGTDSFSVIGGVGSDSDTVISTAGAVLTAYTETFSGETFDTNISSVVETFLSTTGGFGPIATTPGSTSGTVTVTYEYIPVPEPSVFVLCSLGLVGLLLTRRHHGTLRTTIE